MLSDKKSTGGQRLYFLSGTVTSPTLAAQWKKGQATYPSAKWIQYDPVNRDSAYAASKAAFGDYADAQYKLDAADVIVSLDADFLSGAAYPGFHRLAKDYANRRRLEKTSAGDYSMNRLYVVESMSSTTGMKAEHRLALRASDIPGFAAALAAAVGAGSAPSGYTWSDGAQKFLAAVAKDLKASSGKCVVIPGEQQPASVHLAAIAINDALGNVGKTVVYTETVNPMPSIQGEDMKSLVADMNAGKVEWLVILNANPIYSAPADLEFADAFNKVGTVVHLGSHRDETGLQAQWHINGTHYLESWSDARAYDGTVSVVQPMIDPLYGGHSAHEIVQSLLDNPDVSPYDAVRENWSAQTAGKGATRTSAGANCSMTASWLTRPLHQRAAERTRLCSRKVRIINLAIFPGSAGRRLPPIRSRSSSAPIRMSTTGVTPTWAGCRRFRVPSRIFRGTTPR